MSESMVEIRNVTKVYERGKQKVEVLHGLTLDIPKGDYVALMGPSGSGKTTLLNLIGGLDQPTAGEIKVGGNRIDKLSSGELAHWRAHNVGFVFQFYNLMPVLTAEGNVELPLLLTKLSAAQRKKNTAVALQVVGLADRAKHKPRELSGGQEQRVAIARALVSDPQLLVCDEPTGDLDRKTADEILGLLQVLNREHGKTIVMVTHDPKAAEFARRTLHLEKGQLLEQAAWARSEDIVMTKTGFVIANLFRKRTRTVLTLLSVIMAFLLFGLLQSVNSIFNAGQNFVGATRLMTQARVSFTQPLPISMVPKLEAIPGVARVGYSQWFGGVWQENTPIFAFAVDPLRQRDVYPEYTMPDAQWQAFANTRTAMIAGKVVADKYGWKVGQKIPLASNIYPQKNGSKAWAFDLVGIYDGTTEDTKKLAQNVFINHDYFDEANAFGKGRANFFILKLADGKQAEAISKTVDTMFENSPDETKTQTEKDFNLGFVKQIGDIGLIVRWILFAVFFTLLLVVGNTMAQSVRERIPELAVLKTLGFSDGAVLGFVFAEALALCLFGGLIGLVLATLAGAMVEKGSGGQFQLSPDLRVWLLGVTAILVMSIVVGLLPALRARRLRIVDALAGR